MRAIRTLGVTALLLGLATTAGAAEMIYRSVTPSEQATTGVATVGGRAVVSLKDVNEALSIAYYEAEQDLHRRKLEWIRWWTATNLLAMRAADRRQSIEEFLKAELRPDPVTESARNAYLERLWQEAKIEVNLPAPAPPRLFVSELNNGPVIGLADAPMNVLVFCAFTRPECRDGWKSLREAVARLGLTVRIAYRDYPPLGESPHALGAAVAARCAHRAGKFWAYHDLLYENADKLGNAQALKRLAREVGLDGPTFDACLDAREPLKEIEYDILEGGRIGLTRVPSMFVNGVYVPGALPAPELIRALQQHSIQ